MSPRYEIYIPTEEQAAQFEAITKKIGYKVKKLPNEKHESALDDPIREWQRQASIARKLLAQFGSDQNQEVSVQISKGVAKLAHDIGRHVRTNKKYFQFESAPSGLRDALLMTLQSSLHEDIPNWVEPRKIGGQTWGYVRPIDAPPTFLPRHIIYIVEKYGLADGSPKKGDWITETYDIPGFEGYYFNGPHKLLSVHPDLRNYFI